MKISQAIRELQAAQAAFGDIAITGGNMTDDSPLRLIMVTNTDGVEIWPFDTRSLNDDNYTPDGVYLTS
jgi:hypothetical protein